MSHTSVFSSLTNPGPDQTFHNYVSDQHNIDQSTEIEAMKDLIRLLINNIHLPTCPFTILELYNPSYDVLELKKSSIRGYWGSKIVKGLVGCHFHQRVPVIKRWIKSTVQAFTTSIYSTRWQIFRLKLLKIKTSRANVYLLLISSCAYNSGEMNLQWMSWMPTAL